MCIDEELQELFNKQYQEYKFFKDNGDSYNHQKDFFKSLICYKACINHYPNQITELILIGNTYYQGLKPRNMNMANHYFCLAERMFDEFDICESLYEPYIDFYYNYFWDNPTSKTNPKNQCRQKYKEAKVALENNDIALAINLFEEAKDLGDNRAYYMLGKIYESTDINKAFKYYYQGVLEDSGRCYRAIMKFYEKGIIVEKDEVIVKALKRICKLYYIFQNKVNKC